MDIPFVRLEWRRCDNARRNGRRHCIGGFQFSSWHQLLMANTGWFFNWASPENVSRLAPPKNASTGPPLLWKSSKYGGWERGDSEYFNIFNTYGGQSGTLMFFWNQLLTGQHLANSGEAQLKKNTLYLHIYITHTHYTYTLHIHIYIHNNTSTEATVLSR